MMKLKNKYIKNILDLSYNPSAKSELLPYEYFDEKNNIFINKDNNLGFIFESRPIVGVNENLINQLSLLFDEFMPEGGYLQFLMIAGPDVESITKSWLQSYSGQNEILKNLSKNRADYLEGMSRSGQDSFRIKNYRLFISYCENANYTSSNLQKIIEFRENLTVVLKAAGLLPKPVDANELIALITGIIAPDEPAGKFNSYETISRQIAKGCPLLMNHERIKHKNDYVSKCYSFADYPDEFSIGKMINLLGDDSNDYLQIPGRMILSYTISNDISEKKEISMREKGKSVIKALDTFWTRLDFKLKDEGNEWVRAEYALEKNNKKLLSTSFLVALTAKSDEILKVEKNLQSVFVSNDLKLSRADYFIRPSFLSILPFAAASGLFKELKRLNFAKTTTSEEPLSLLPIHSEWKGNGSSGLLFAGRRGQLFCFDPFISNDNYNLWISGTSGSGKSVLLQDLVTNLMADNAKVFLMDLGQSFTKLCRLLDGDLIQFTRTTAICLNPFWDVKFSTAEDLDDFLDLIKPIIAKMAAPQRGATDMENALIDKALKATWNKYGNNCDITKIAEELEEMEHPVAKDLALLLFPYTIEGNYGKYFHGRPTVHFSEKKFTVIEFEELKEREDLRVVMIQMFSVQVTNKIFTGDRKQRHAIIIDEAWFGLEHFPKLIVNMAKTVRKYNTTLVLATQSISDLYTNPLAKSLLTNFSWRITLKQQPEAVEELREFSKLSQSEINLIQSLRTSRGKYSECLIASKDMFCTARLILDNFSKILYSTQADEFSRVESLVQQGMSIADAVSIVAEDVYESV